MKYQIWREGFKAQGESDTAQFLAEIEAIDFPDAVKEYYRHNPSETFNTDRLTDWGMHHYDNEVDARRSFG